MGKLLEHTGERFIPGQTHSILTHAFHISRYQYALESAEGKTILDVGCGAGYGTAMLANVAQIAFGCDISYSAIQFAAQEYSKNNLHFSQMDCQQLGFPASKFDLVISFEMIEHILGQKQLLAEIKRVLKPDGTLIISTPEKTKYNELHYMAKPNEYHVKELSDSEFHELLRSYFSHVQILWQTVDPLVLQLITQARQLINLEKRVASLEGKMEKPWLALLQSLLPKRVRLWIPRDIKKRVSHLVQPSPQGLGWQGMQLPQPEHISMKMESTQEAVFMVAICQK